MVDIYDEFGTFEEIEILTEAIRRWDVNCMDELPDYMQIFFHALLNLFNEIEEGMVKEGNSCRVHYAKEAWKATARPFFDGYTKDASHAWRSICMLQQLLLSEKERGHEASSVDCYMKQHGVSEQEALDVFNKQVFDLWKDINEDLLIRPNAVPRPVLMRVLNLTRVVDLVYEKGDGFTHVGKLMKDIVTSLFLDPVPL
ncbi:hypothetical protein ACE6H2_014700 [Prunus campanulata]